MTITKWILGDSDDDSLILSILGLSRWIYMFRILMEEMNKFLDCSSVEQVGEMMETLAERLYDNCTSDIQKAGLISIFTDAVEE